MVLVGHVVEPLVSAPPLHHPEADGPDHQGDGDDGQVDVDPDVRRVEKGDGGCYRL